MQVDIAANRATVNILGTKCDLEGTVISINQVTCHNDLGDIERVVDSGQIIGPQVLIVERYRIQSLRAIAHSEVKVAPGLIVRVLSYLCYIKCGTAGMGHDLVTSRIDNCRCLQIQLLL